jgi:four helix bundle protein
MERVFESFEELNPYKILRETRSEVSNLTKIFPKIEEFRLTRQIIRVSRLVTANIAEGHGRHFPETKYEILY